MSETEPDLSAQLETLLARLARVERILHLQALNPASPETGEDDMAGSTQSNYCHGNSHASMGCVLGEDARTR